ncbi:MAG: cell wall-binding repeat-containing protein [Chloroflexi bacterium]|nr:cell wall-binding repeat-containing protein [Chloroflexota bacterium]
MEPRSASYETSTVAPDSPDLFVQLDSSPIRIEGPPEATIDTLFTPAGPGIRESIRFRSTYAHEEIWSRAQITLFAPDGGALQPGTYLDANVVPTGPLAVYGFVDNTGDFYPYPGLTGWFEILELSVTAGVVDQFAARVHLYQNTHTFALLELRYHSSVPWKGVAPALTSFEPVHIGDSATTAETFAVVGTAPVKFGTASLAADPAFSIESDTCSGLAIQPGDSCAVVLKFAPTSLIQETDGLLQVPNDSLRTPWQVGVNAATAVDVRIDFSGSGGGSVQSSKGTCTTNCTLVYGYNTVFGLTAVPAAGSAFDHWTGPCTGTGVSCARVASTATMDFGAVFSIGRTLKVTRTGPGVVTSSPGGINCGTDCTEFYPETRTVTLTATPTGDAQFYGWTGSCTGTGACVLPMSTSRTVQALFDEPMPNPAATGTSTGLRSSGGFDGAYDDAYRCRNRPCLEPPDPWIAVGPSHVVQATNDGIRVYDRSGTLLRNWFLWDFFGEDTSSVADGDPRVVYDVAHGRWIAIELSSTCDQGSLQIAVSTTSSPLGSWALYAFHDAGFIDFPGLGISNNKLAIGYDLFGLSSCTVYEQVAGKIVVIELTPLVAASSQVPSTLLTFPTLLSPRPATTVGQGSDIWVVAGGATEQPAADVIAGRILGLPSQQTVGLYGIDGSTPGPTNLSQTMGLQRLANPTGLPLGLASAFDGRPTDAVAIGNMVWFVANNRCVPNGDTVGRACVRVTKIGVNGVVQNFTIGVVGQSTFGGGIGLSGNGTLFVAYSQASADAKVTTFITHQRVGDAVNSIRKPARLSGSTSAYAGSRWGDYVGIAPDPTDAGAVWQGNQRGNGPGWGTFISKVSSAAGGPTGSVTINGGASTTTATTVTIVATTGTGSQSTEVLVSNSPTTVGGKLSKALRLPAGRIAGWSLTNVALGGTNATGTRTVYVQFGNGADTWSAVHSDSISFTAQEIVRLSGTDRYATAAAVSAATFAPGVEVAYVSVGTAFPEPLVAAAAAGWLRGPLLLTGTQLPTATRTELARLKPRFIVVVGSTSAIPDSVAQQLESYATSGVVFRDTGSDRYVMAAVVALNAFYEPGVPAAFVAYGGNFPDALAAAAAAGKAGGPVLYTPTNTLPYATVVALQNLKPAKIYVVGGPSVVSKAVADALVQYATTHTVIRLAGADRYATAVAISKAFFAPGVEVAYIAYGLNFPDALAGAAAAGFRGGPVLLTPTNSLNAATAAELTRLKPKRIVVLGGTSVISSAVYQTLAGYATGP